MYKCLKCGETFTLEEAGTYYNPCPYGERVVYEKLIGCPCGSGRIEEIGEENDDEDDSEA